MINPYAILVGAIVVMLAVAGAGWKGHQIGVERTESKYAKRDLEAATTYAAKEREITDTYRKKEATWTQSFSDAGKKFQRELDKNATDHLAILAGIDAKRLRDPYATDCKAGGSEGGAVAANTLPANSGGSELSAEFDQFLKSEAARADGAVIKLNFCIGLLEAERLPASP